VAERPIPGTEGPRGHELRPPVDDRRVPLRVFIAIGLFVGFMATVYAATAYEASGIIMLYLAAVLGLWIGAYLWLQQRPSDGIGAGERVDVSEVVEAPTGTRQVETKEAPPDQEQATATVAGVPVADERDVVEAAGEAAAAHGLAMPTDEVDEYLPHASVWPFAIGVGSAAIFVGLVLGIWVALPGIVLLALGVGGFVRQTRRRD
jgi:hypothetical protein